MAYRSPFVSVYDYTEAVISDSPAGTTITRQVPIRNTFAGGIDTLLAPIGAIGATTVIEFDVPEGTGLTIAPGLGDWGVTWTWATWSLAVVCRVLDRTGATVATNTGSATITARGDAFSGACDATGVMLTPDVATVDGFSIEEIYSGNGSIEGQSFSTSVYSDSVLLVTVKSGLLKVPVYDGYTFEIEATISGFTLAHPDAVPGSEPNDKPYAVYSGTTTMVTDILPKFGETVMNYPEPPARYGPYSITDPVTGSTRLLTNQVVYTNYPLGVTLSATARSCCWEESPDGGDLYTRSGWRPRGITGTWRRMPVVSEQWHLCAVSSFPPTMNEPITQTYTGNPVTFGNWLDMNSPVIYYAMRDAIGTEGWDSRIWYWTTPHHTAMIETTGGRLLYARGQIASAPKTISQPHNGFANAGTSIFRKTPGSAATVVDSVNGSAPSLMRDNANHLWLGFTPEGGGGTLYQSRDNGDTWELAMADIWSTDYTSCTFARGAGNGFISAAIKPASSQPSVNSSAMEVWFKHDDGSLSWGATPVQVTSYSTNPLQAYAPPTLTYDGKYIYCLSFGSGVVAVHRSADYGATWEAV